MAVAMGFAKAITVFVTFPYFGFAALPPLSAVWQARLQDIIKQMTPAEKARQLQTASGNDYISNGAVDAIKTNKSLGNLGQGRLHDIYCTDAHVCNELQAAVANSSRFGIGAIFGEECTHGFQKDGHTIFPAPITSGATFNKSLLKDIGAAMAAEARAFGTHECWSPILGLAREPRWGRTNEEFSEDLHLVKTFGEQMTLGLQADGNLSADNAVSALLKHYAMYSVPMSGINTAPVQMGRRAALGEFLPAFGGALRAGAQGVMSSYNTVDGEPVSGSSWLLTEVLRDFYGFDGLVVADFGAISRLSETHHVAVNDADSVRQFLEAGGNCRGLDLSTWEQSIVDLVSPSGAKGGFKMNMTVLDSRVMDVLRVKVRLGLVPLHDKGLIKMTDPTLAAKVNNSPKHKAIAARAAHEAQVLLQNRGAVLPFDAKDISKLAVIGPNADQPRFGDYSGAEHHRGGNINNVNCVGVLGELKAALPNVSITHEVGASVAGPSGGCGSGSFYQPIYHHHFVNSSAKGGVKAEYYSSLDLTGEPVLRRVDAALSFHWFRWGADPVLLPQSAWSVRWTGTIVSDTTAAGGGAGFLLKIDRMVKFGARLWLDNKLVIDRWNEKGQLKENTVDYNFTAGHEIPFVLEFWKDDHSGDHNGGELELLWDQLGADPIARSVAAVHASDHVVLVVGGSDTTSNEGVDRSSLALPGLQLDLVQAVTKAAKASGAKLALVLIQGKPLAEPWIKDNVDAILESFLAGQAQGTATVDVLLGKYNPAGRLSVTFPRSVGQLPNYYSMHEKHNSYCDSPSDPLWVFGHGLSYTSFNYSDLQISGTTVKPNGLVHVSCKVANVGLKDGDEVVQLYVRDEHASVTTPLKALKGYERVHVKAKQTVTVTFTIDVAEELQLVGRDFKWVVEPGVFTVMVGGSSASVDGGQLPLSGSFTVGQATLSDISVI